MALLLSMSSALRTTLDRPWRRYDSLVVFGALLAVALLPTLCWFVPPAMTDYANHLARMFLLSRDKGSNSNPFYDVTWALYPNLAMDLLVPQMARVFSVETATRLFYLLSQILIISGAVALERIVKSRFEVAGFIALSFLYAIPFAWGFLNFEFALGCALWAIACAYAVQDRSLLLRLTVQTLVIPLLFVAHMFALGIYGFTIVVHELWRGVVRREKVFTVVARLSVIAFPALVMLILMLGTGGRIGGSRNDWLLATKPFWLVIIMNGYSITVSVACFVLASVGTIQLARTGCLKFRASGLWLALGFSFLYIAMPFRLHDTAFVDMRVIVAAALILPAFISVSFPNATIRMLALAGVATLTVLNAATALDVWASYRADYADIKDSFKVLPKHSIVLVGDTGRAEDPPIGHLVDYPRYGLPILAVHYADAFVPTLFTEAGKQPVSVKASWRRLDLPYGGPVPLSRLKKIALQGYTSATPPFIRKWDQDFDYLYLINPPVTNPIPRLLEEVWRGRRFALYRIRQEQSPGGHAAHEAQP